MELGGVEDEVRPQHVLAVGDGPAARVHDGFTDREVLVEVVVAGEAMFHGGAHRSRSLLAMTSYWISLVPSKMRNTRASLQ